MNGPDRAGPSPPNRIEQIHHTLWATVPSALATEFGALVELGLGAVAGMTAGLIAVIVLGALLMPRPPAPPLVRLALLVGGPPLRYGLLLVAAWYEWMVRGSGPLPSLAAVVVLAVVVPMAGAVLTGQHRAGSARR